MEVNNCCGTTCDKILAIKEQSDLQKTLDDFVEAYDQTQSENLLQAMGGYSKLGNLIRIYKRDQREKKDEAARPE